MLGIPFKLVDAMQHRMEQRYGRSFAALDVHQVAPLIDASTLVIHDPADSIVPFEHGQHYVHLLRHAQLAPLADCGHFRILQSSAAVRLAVDFVTARHGWRVPERISPAW